MKILEYNYHKFKEFKDKLIMVVNNEYGQYILFIKQVVEHEDSMYFLDTYFGIDVDEKKFMKPFRKQAFGHIFPENATFYELNNFDDFQKTIELLFTIN